MYYYYLLPHFILYCTKNNKFSEELTAPTTLQPFSVHQMHRFNARAVHVNLRQTVPLKQVFF